MDSTLKTTDADGNERLLEDRHREILKGFYSVFKAADKDLQFVLLTGVTKFSQVSVFSGFNQPEDISLSAHFDTLLGITEDELQSTFAQQITEMAEEYDVSKEDMLIKLKRQFDGYHSVAECEAYIILSASCVPSRKCSSTTIGSKRVHPPIWFAC